MYKDKVSSPAAVLYTHALSLTCPSLSTRWVGANAEQMASPPFTSMSESNTGPSLPRGRMGGNSEQMAPPPPKYQKIAHPFVYENLSSDQIIAHKAKSTFGGESTVLGHDVMRFDPEVVKTHIKDVITRNPKEASFRSIGDLKAAANSGRLRPGQLIFGTVSIAHHEDVEGTLRGWLYNVLTPFIMKIKTGQMRNCAYLHTAVYAGLVEGQHYVIENGGADPHGIGTIDVNFIDDAFEQDSSLFVVSPPKDNTGRSTRYMVLQKALACIGLQYKYNMRAVSCETFATALLGVLHEEAYTPLQLEVLRTHRNDHPDIADQKKRDTLKFKQFHEDLCQQVEQVPIGTILTLKSYIKARNHPMFTSSGPWFLGITKAYEKLFQSARRGDTNTCMTLLKFGLSVEGQIESEQTYTVLEIAAREGHQDTVEALLNKGAQKRNEALVLAIERGYISIANVLHESGAVFDPSFATNAMIRASEMGNIENLRAFLNLGADIESTDDDGNTSLLAAVAAGQTTTVITLIEDLGANFEHENDAGETAIILASEGEHPDLIKELIKMGANIKHEDHEGNTPFLIAMRKKNNEIMRMLLDAGAIETNVFDFIRNYLNEDS